MAAETSWRREALHALERALPRARHHQRARSRRRKARPLSSPAQREDVADAAPPDHDGSGASFSACFPKNFTTGVGWNFALTCAMAAVRAGREAPAEKKTPKGATAPCV